MKDQALTSRCRRLRLVLTDVDGVLTDGALLLLPDGTELKALNVRDGLGIVLAHRAGLRTGVLSGRSSPLIQRRAEELGMSVVRQGVRDKGAELERILTQETLTKREVAYIGDDVSDLPVMRAVGLSAAPADAPLEVRAQAFMVTEARGGRGCFREFLEAILRSRSEWEAAVASLDGAPPI